ncbi:hypothetical protein [Fibrella aquatilis]|uniref:Outer membrane protein beta-barrel domain-containing protein n=1 Tax=Fibrella aquatilis TaxID=2817059 RepID=A0A939GAT9_9BACT|nr:hypothetical protein [Fibrella aquatilis]MBO0933839.1 hypothetical protein [Fibrella aquatilis]
MKTYLLWLTIWLGAGLCFGQSSKLDVIVKTDGSRIACRVLRVGKTAIQYQPLNSTKPLFISKNRVSKLLYGQVTTVPVAEPVVKKPPSSLPKIDQSPTKKSAEAPPPSRPPTPSLSKQASTAQRFTLQLNAMPVYMFGTTEWTSVKDGLGHAIGVGSTAQFDYLLAKDISIGAELGYVAWNTQISAVANKGEEPFYTYHSKATQLLGMAHVRFMLDKRFYIMPQGGMSLLDVRLSNDEGSDGFRGTQTCYGGAVGGLFRLSRAVNLDASLFYRHATASKTLQDERSVTPMKYAGLRLGLGFSW